MTRLKPAWALLLPLVPLVMSWRSLELEYRAVKVCVLLREAPAPRPWSAMATKAAQAGAPKLVPPVWNQPV